MEINATTPNAFNTSFHGIQRSSEQVTAASQTIAQQGAHDVGAIVSLVEGEQTYAANVKAFAASSRMLGVLLDTEA